MERGIESWVTEEEVEIHPKEGPRDSGTELSVKTICQQCIA